jgi:hypothetical protein
VKKVEIRELGISSLVKVTLYFSIIPIALMIIVGVLAFIVGLISGERAAIVFGMLYLAMPIAVVIIYGVTMAIGGVLYNAFSSKFGGLEIFIKDKE